MSNQLLYFPSPWTGIYLYNILIWNDKQIWEFEEAHQRWLPLIELGSAEDKGDRVHAVAWAPNIGRLAPSWVSNDRPLGCYV
jgi:hypothetical protein